MLLDSIVLYHFILRRYYFTFASNDEYIVRKQYNYSKPAQINKYYKQSSNEMPQFTYGTIHLVRPQNPPKSNIFCPDMQTCLHDVMG